MEVIANVSVIVEHQHVLISLPEEARPLLALERTGNNLGRGVREVARIRRSASAVNAIAVAGGRLAGGRQLGDSDIAGLGFGLKEKLRFTVAVSGNDTERADLALIDERLP